MIVSRGGGAAAFALPSSFSLTPETIRTVARACTAGPVETGAGGVAEAAAARATSMSTSTA